MENIVVYDGLLWVVVERAVVSVLHPDGERYMDKLVRLELLEPALELGPGASIWVALYEIQGLVSNLSWQDSEWCLGVFNGINQND